MALSLVQNWGPLGPLPDHPMGDEQTASADSANAPPSRDLSSARLPSGGGSGSHGLSDGYDYQSLAGAAPGNQGPFQFQLPQQQQSSPTQYRPKEQNPMQPDQTHTSRFGSSLNMASLANALPDGGYAPANYGQQQRFSPSMPNPALMYQIQQIPQYTGQTMSPNPSYNVQHQGMYGPQPSVQQALHLGASPAQQFLPNQPFLGPPQVQQIAPYYYNQIPYSAQAHHFSSPSYQGQFTSRSNTTSEGARPDRQRSTEGTNTNIGQGVGVQGQSGGLRSSPGQSPAPRGPPRKPKQSGHALWVGNLPPGANVIDLKDHFSREAMHDILSVFLISKSNCAFVNYKTEASCAAAMSRFHDARFQGVRLVCRLRRTSVNAVSGVPTGPAALSSQQDGAVNTSLVDGQKGSSEDDVSGLEPNNAGTFTVKDKYFIVKSLTVEDLDMSVRNGIWATQSHNEDALNKAYETADNVYLIFSANKSGEYFGYGRMTSLINEDPAAAIEFAPKAQAVANPDLPKAIQTEASGLAPKGRIIDDSARGTIFWEAEGDDTNVSLDGEDNGSEHSDAEGETGSAAKAWGKPFTIEWMSTNRLPFYRTRGLRNPWNSNREVKIARDGTELETSIGRRLIAMFHRDLSPLGPNMAMPLPMMGGHSQTRPY
ncbi:MAG: hypothetical protein M1818_001006 [Claussenomyces sp. TS43310]|nr:MAG: hypothetical protein M1818_001006 [Claussenomyces sp. TS43310]